MGNVAILGWTRSYGLETQKPAALGLDHWRCSSRCDTVNCLSYPHRNAACTADTESVYGALRWLHHLRVRAAVPVTGLLLTTASEGWTTSARRRIRSCIHLCARTPAQPNSYCTDVHLGTYGGSLLSAVSKPLRARCCTCHSWDYSRHLHPGSGRSQYASRPRVSDVPRATSTSPQPLRPHCIHASVRDSRGAHALLCSPCSAVEEAGNRSEHHISPIEVNGALIEV